MAIYIGEPESIRQQLDVIVVLMRRGELAPLTQHTIIEDTPWVKTRWPNPRYL